MYAGRLGNVRKQEDSHRKFMCVMNEMARNRFDLTTNYIDKEMNYNTHRQDRSQVQIKREMVQRKILLKCMEMRREDTVDSDNNNLYGHYGGRPMQAFHKDIETYKEETDPKKQKKKQINELMKTSRETGLVMGSAKMNEKVRGYLSKRWGVKYPEKSENKMKPRDTFKPKKEEEEEMPSITVSAFFKPNVGNTKRRGRHTPGLFDADTPPAGAMSVEDARRMLYPGEDKHKNCKKCFHVPRVSHFTKTERTKFDHSPSPNLRALSEPPQKQVLDTNTLVLPNIARRKSLTHR